MKELTILEYAEKHLDSRIEKLESNLESETVSKYQRGVFERNLEKCRLEKKEIRQRIIVIESETE